MRRLVWVGALGFLVSCGSSPPASMSNADAPSPSPTPSSTAEDNCGEVLLKQGEVLAMVGATEVDCLERALRENRSAGLTITAPTVEGDPIVTSWHLAADGTLAADIDASKDRFSSEGHTHVSCGRVTELPNLLTCEPNA